MHVKQERESWVLSSMRDMLQSSDNSYFLLMTAEAADKLKANIQTFIDQRTSGPVEEASALNDRVDECAHR
ncbi:hypothetical protein ACFPOB_21665 [Bosea eneae]|uniref:Uncharacterized protein n=1 Tax=Bosea eneae TaxID=151454 RepID=A0ABW0IVM9_9HYPH